MDERIQISGLVKVFGSNPQKALTMLKNGKDKDEILHETGVTVGINNINLGIKEGEIFAIMGLSGSGKSTVLRCINRLIKPSSGQIIVDGTDIMKLKAKELRKFRQDKIAMVFQQFALLPHLTVLENTAYGLEVQGVPKDEREKKATFILEVVGLKGYECQYPNQLSGGMKQRVGLARALTNDTDILLMDEAFSALDPLIREEMQDELLAIQEKMNKTIVFVTHDLNEALKLGDRIAFLKDGCLIQVGTPEEIISCPANEYIAKFISNVDKSKVLTAADVMKKPHPLILLRDGPGVALRTMKQYGLSSVFVVDRDKKLKGIITAEKAVEAVKNGIKNLRDLELDHGPVITEDTYIQDTLNVIADSKLPMAVVDDTNKLLGIIVRGSVLAALVPDSLNSKDSLSKEDNRVHLLDLLDEYNKADSDDSTDKGGEKYD